MKIYGNMSSRYINQEEFDCLRELAKDGFEGYKKEIDGSYQLGRITAREISMLPQYENGALKTSENNQL